jgi:hypothetical protein
MIPMKHVLILIILLTSFSSLLAQKPKYDKKTNEVTLEGEHVFNIIRTCDFGQNCRFDVYDLAGERVMRINFLSFKSPVEVSSSNPTGNVDYLEFIFLESGKKAEYSIAPIHPKRVAAIIINNDLIKDGELNVEAMDEFILTNGTRFSERIRL